MALVEPAVDGAPRGQDPPGPGLSLCSSVCQPLSPEHPRPQLRGSPLRAPHQPASLWTSQPSSLWPLRWPLTIGLHCSGRQSMGKRRKGFGWSDTSKWEC